MAINGISLTAESVTINTDAVIEMVYTEPLFGEILDPPLTPNVLIGYYNGSTGVVNLYVVDNSGLRLLRVS